MCHCQRDRLRGLGGDLPDGHRHPHRDPRSHRSYGALLPLQQVSENLIQHYALMWVAFTRLMIHCQKYKTILAAGTVRIKPEVSTAKSLLALKKIAMLGRVICWATPLIVSCNQQ